ncbi:MAG TPA: DNA recombination protein RmuC, partial [Polyangiaceae bacterium]|nr:DNA recombination protein RmuC [Polyangiaceae bacterium]
MTDHLIAVTAFLAGTAFAWWVRSTIVAGALRASRARIDDLTRQLGEERRELEALSREHDRLAERLRSEIERRARAESDLDNERKGSTEKLAVIQQAETALSDAFKALSAEALKSNNRAFLDLARATLEKHQESARNELEARQKAVDELVRPMRESLEKVDGKLGEIEKVRIGAYAALDQQLKSLVETHLPALRGETANLVKALRQPAVRGRWGEIQLKRVVEMAGMLGHCDFKEQESRATEDGRIRPDLVVRLPGGKQIVVDAKAPTEAYLKALEASDETEQRALLADHAAQVRSHMLSLGRKSYWEQFEATPEFVVMFLPGEVFFSAALQQDPALIEFGVNERVIPATPTTLIALLRAVAYGWRQEALAQNAQEVAELGRQLYERVASLAKHWSDVGDRLDKAVESYNRSVGTLESRVLVSARKLSELRTAPEGVEIRVIEPVERTTRRLTAVELLASSSN